MMDYEVIQRDLGRLNKRTSDALIDALTNGERLVCVTRGLLADEATRAVVALTTTRVLVLKRGLIRSHTLQVPLDQITRVATHGLVTKTVRLTTKRGVVEEIKLVGRQDGKWIAEVQRAVGLG